MKISIIIPTLNEEKNIGRLLRHLKVLPNQDTLHEVIVCDGGSDDDTASIVEAYGANLIESNKRSRAIQMNQAASVAKGDILYFVHADVLPPKSCLSDIVRAVKAGNLVGCFSYNFNSNKKALKFNEFFLKFDSLLSGGGDQTLYVEQNVFKEAGRFREDYAIMEDFDFVWRIKKRHTFHIIKKNALVSARKYENNSYLKVQIANTIVFLLFRMGVSPNLLSRFYKQILN